MIQTVTNLYPYPEQPVRGIFNLQLFRELAKLAEVRNAVLVANSNPLRAKIIRKWSAPADVSAATYVPYQHVPIIGRNHAWRFAARALQHDLECCGVVQKPEWRGAALHRQCHASPACLVSQRDSGRLRGADGRDAPGGPEGRGDEIQSRPTSETRMEASAPTAVLASWLYPDGVAAAMAYRDVGVPVWTMVLGTDRFHLVNARRRKVILKADRYTTGYICVAQNIIDDLKAYGIADEKLHLIRNGVDTTRFHPIPREQAIERLSDCHHGAATLSEAGSLVVFVGNLVPIKAPDLAIKAFACLVGGDGRRDDISPHRQCSASPACLVSQRDSGRLHGAHGRDAPAAPEGRGDEIQSRPTSELRELPACDIGADAQLVLIGDGPLRGALETLAAELGIAERVHFMGRRSHDEMPLWLNVADCLVLASKSEGMPNAVAEALACGCPVVATDVGACREMLSAQPGCCTVRERTPEILGDALCGVLQESIRTQVPPPTFTRTWMDMAKDVLSKLG